MHKPYFRELSLVCLITSCCPGFYTDVGSYPLTACEDDGDYRQGPIMQNLLCGLSWQDQSKEQTQNVFKRFLFHYSKAQNSVGTVQRESHSIHPLMRLSPKFALRRKKQQTSFRS